MMTSLILVQCLTLSGSLRQERSDELLSDPLSSPEINARVAEDLARFLPPRTFLQIRDLVGFPALIAAAREALDSAVFALQHA